MGDYMNRQTAADLLDNLVGMVEDTQENDYDAALKMGIEALKAHAQPVRHGHWIRGSGYPHHIFCSICYATYVPNDEWDIWKTDGSDCFRLQRNFCPYCGADMRGEQNG